MTEKVNRLGFTLGVMIGVLGNFVASFFVEAIRAIADKHLESIPAWIWATLFIVFSGVFFHFTKIAWREIFGMHSEKRLNIAAIMFFIAGIVLIITDIANV
jgi:hypothetical protein